MAYALPPLTRVRRPLPGPGSPRRFSASPPTRPLPAQSRRPRSCPLTPASLHVRHPSPISRARRARLPRRSSVRPPSAPPPLTRAPRSPPEPGSPAGPASLHPRAPLASRARLPAGAALRPPHPRAPRPRGRGRVTYERGSVASVSCPENPHSLTGLFHGIRDRDTEGRAAAQDVDADLDFRAVTIEASRQGRWPEEHQARHPGLDTAPKVVSAPPSSRHTAQVSRGPRSLGSSHGSDGGDTSRLALLAKR
jgi:hypothetical protein